MDPRLFRHQCGFLQHHVRGLRQRGRSRTGAGVRSKASGRAALQGQERAGRGAGRAALAGGRHAEPCGRHALASESLSFAKVADTCWLRAKRTTSSATFSCRLANTFTAKHAISASVSADRCRRRGRPSAAADGRAPGAHRPRLAACRRTCLRQLLGALQQVRRLRPGKGRMKVSWQLTGIRKNPWAQAHPLVVQQEKPASERSVRRVMTIRQEVAERQARLVCAFLGKGAPMRQRVDRRTQGSSQAARAAG